MLPSRERTERIRRSLFLFFTVGAVFGMIVSPPVLSIGLIGIFAVGVLDPRRGINPRWQRDVRAFLRQPPAQGLLLLYAVLLLGIWQTYDWPYYLERLRIKIPLLALPLAWPGLPPLDRKWRAYLWTALLVLPAVVLSGVLVNYALHFSEINDLVARGGSVPVPRNHIRFSLLVAVSVFSALYAADSRFLGRRIIWWAVAGYLFLGLHLLAVRSGLVGVYGGLAVFFLARAVYSGRWRTSLAVLVALVLLPVIAYVSVPSLRTKIRYTRYELFHRDRSVSDQTYSDEGRLTSIRIGWAVFREYPVVGVGPGNLRAEMDRRYAELLPGVEGKRPHNQFVSALAGSGLVGGLLTVAAFGLLLYAGVRNRDPAYLAVWTVFFLSCLVENTLENTLGVSAFCLFLLLQGATPRGGPIPSPLPAPPPSPRGLSESAS